VLQILLIFSDIIDHADDDLFKQILSKPNHVLAHVANRYFALWIIVSYAPDRFC